MRFSSCHLNISNDNILFLNIAKISEDVPTTFEHFQSYFNGDILVCCDKGKCHFGIILFSGMFNLIFVINHVLKNNLSRFFSQA